MEHLTRIAFWIASVCLIKLVFSVPVPGHIDDFHIGLMRKEIKCDNESVFYAPENVETKCLIPAMRCIVKELNELVKVECDDDNKRIGQVLGAFEEHFNVTTDSAETPGCVCELWPETSFSEFLSRTESIIQQVYSEKLTA